MIYARWCKIGDLWKLFVSGWDHLCSYWDNIYLESSQHESSSMADHIAEIIFHGWSLHTFIYRNHPAIDSVAHIISHRWLHGWFESFPYEILKLDWLLFFLMYWISQTNWSSMTTGKLLPYTKQSIPNCEYCKKTVFCWLLVCYKQKLKTENNKNIKLKLKFKNCNPKKKINDINIQIWKTNI